MGPTVSPTVSPTMSFEVQSVQLGVSAIVFPSPGPWDREVFRYLDESVIRPFAGGCG